MGAGLCCVAVTPDGHYMVFDAGNYKDRGRTAMEAIEELIPYGSTIDLLVLSHCDADHLAAVPFICKNYHVREVWRDGFESDTDTWGYADRAIKNEVEDEGCEDVNLQLVRVEPGYQVDVGEAVVTFLCGFADIPPDWPRLNAGEDRNARSIVARMDFGHSSVLFGGDSVGRHIGDDDTVCIAAEAFLVANQSNVSINVDVVIAPHHGADNGSSLPFVQATSPRYVVFSAGSAHHHPHRGAARRYLQAGVLESNIFRTDRGDNEGYPEWRSRSGSSPDPRGDDDVEIIAARNGSVQVQYSAQVGPIFQPFALLPESTPRPLRPERGLSPQIREWIEKDEMWTESHEDIEAHTQERATTPVPQARSICPPVCCIYQPRPCRMRHRFWRMCR